MKKIGMLCIVFILLFTLFPGVSVSVTANSNEKVIVLFKDKVDKRLIEQARGTVNREYKSLPALSISIPSIAIKGLQNNPNVVAIELDHQNFSTDGQTQDWGISRVSAPDAWQSGLTGSGVKIAVLDTGISNHEDLVISGGASFTSYTTSFSDDNGHGTHVARIIGAKDNHYGTVGIGHDSHIYAVKVMDQNGDGYLSDVIAGIDWSITNHMDIINLSLGTTQHSSTLKQIVDKAYSQGILVVAVAGNNGTSEGSGDTVNYPAKYDSVVAVSATDSSDKRSSFSATGSTVEVSAPGVGILSTYPGNRYARMNGTSMAAPYVAGNLALLKEQNLQLNAFALRKLLQENVIDLGPEGKDDWFGFGLIQSPVNKDKQEPTAVPEQDANENLSPLKLLKMLKMLNTIELGNTLIWPNHRSTL
ncbi:S8 family peptidase (plasmid) [Alkalihalophilus pseudofirmus]|uniref:S8 family peptidase n=1 Tax=Alkalihalophilus pseudofirmus TaxID=79885 RepID=UPI00259B55E0|nr:S8 family peptidase [Alkalihalophilus pseudofirmus]WEG19269.1 S8 family peptidase [Alkalihalophilus pseudofirmus]